MHRTKISGDRDDGPVRDGDLSLVWLKTCIADPNGMLARRNFEERKGAFAVGEGGQPRRLDRDGCTFEIFPGVLVTHLAADHAGRGSPGFPGRRNGMTGSGLRRIGPMIGSYGQAEPREQQGNGLLSFDHLRGTSLAL